jgi:tripartite-type tricarboxylate transporter receptor subunit TctC
MKLPHRRQFLHLAAGAAALPAVSRVARAQAYPTRPITMIVPFPAGGPADALARIMAEHMRTLLGQSVIIENVSGAGGSIGVGRVARAAPDGYTVSIGHWGTHVLNGASYQLPYDVVQDFEPVSLLADSPQWIVARKTLPAKDLRELIAWLKENPGKATAGTVGVGGVGNRRYLLPEEHRYELPIRTQRRRPPLSRYAGWAHRLRFRPGGEQLRACAQRQPQSLRGDGQDPMGRSAGDPHD